MSEKLLQSHGNHLHKFSLHISPEYQSIRLIEYITNPKKYIGNIMTRIGKQSRIKTFFYTFTMKFPNTIEKNRPWHVIPSDQNRHKEYLIAEKIVETFKKMDLKYAEK